jgi:hypothetical protein
MNNFFIALVFLAIFWTSCTQQQHADLIISGGNIYTVNDQQPTVEAVAIKDEKIIFAGSEAEARKFISDDTEILDLQGKTMTPGFIEGHGHIMGIGYAELNLDLMEVKSYEELVEKVKNAFFLIFPQQISQSIHKNSIPHFQIKDSAGAAFLFFHLFYKIQIIENGCAQKNFQIQ